MAFNLEFSKGPIFGMIFGQYAAIQYFFRDNKEGYNPFSYYEQMLCLLKSLGPDGEFDELSFAEQLLIWREQHTGPISKTINTAITHMAQKLPVDQWGLTGDDRLSSGSLLRCAPMALLKGPTIKDIYRQTVTTHAELLCQKCDAILVNSLVHLLNGLEKEVVYMKAVQTARNLEEPLILSALQQVRDLKESQLVASHYVVDSLCNAYWVMLNGQSFTHSCELMPAQGEGVELIGTVCGALYGFDAIPQEILPSSEHYHNLESLLPFLQQKVS